MHRHRQGRASCTGPDVAPDPGVTAYLDVTATPGSEGTTPVSVTLSAPDTESVTVTGENGVAASGHAASFADQGRLGVVEVGAPLISCPSSAKGCAEAQARTSGSLLNNDSWDMVGLDDDADKATQTSSSTKLDLPASATITWAGLYWSANTPDDAGVDELARICLAAPGQEGTSMWSLTASTPGFQETDGPALPVLCRRHLRGTRRRQRHLVGGRRRCTPRPGPLRRLGVGRRLLRCLTS